MYLRYNISGNAEHGREETDSYSFVARAVSDTKERKRMKRFLFKSLAAGALLTAALAMTSFAATSITNVSIKSGPDDTEVQSGVCVSPSFYSDSGAYEVSYSDTSSSDDNPKKEHTYEIRLDANDGYYFPKETSVNVSVAGVTRIVKKDTEDSTTFIIRVRAYPYYQWPEVTGVEGVSADSTKISWEKGGASKWEYVLEWTDTYGEEKSKHGTTTTNSISVKSYNKKYTGSSSDREDSKVTAFAVRAVGNAGSNTRVANGVWTGGADYSEYNEEYSSWYDAVGNTGSTDTQTSGSTGSSTNTGTGTPGSSATLPSYVVRGTWNEVPQGSGQWTFTGTDGHLYRNEWAAVDNSQYANTAAGQQLFDWFFFDENGYMHTGWYRDPSTGYWYYLQELSNGVRGRMVTGSYTINGKTYQFSDVSDGYRGHCLNPNI